MPTPLQPLKPLGRAKSWSTLPCCCAFILGVAGLVGHAQGSMPKRPGTAAAATPPASPKHLPPLQFDTNAPLHNLNPVLSCYRRATTDDSSLALPSATTYQTN